METAKDLESLIARTREVRADCGTLREERRKMEDKLDGLARSLSTDNGGIMRFGPVENYADDGFDPITLSGVGCDDYGNGCLYSNDHDYAIYFGSVGLTSLIEVLDAIEKELESKQ